MQRRVQPPHWADKTSSPGKALFKFEVASALSPQIWPGVGGGGVREIAFLARPMGLSHRLTVICQRQMEGEERQRRGERGGTELASYHSLDRPTFYPSRGALSGSPPRDVHTTGLVSLSWVMSDSTGVLCPCGPCCAPTSLPMCRNLALGAPSAGLRETVLTLIILLFHVY